MLENTEYKINLRNVELFEFNFKQVIITNGEATNFNFDILVTNQPLPDNILLQIVSLGIKEINRVDILANIKIAYSFFIENLNEIIKIDENSKTFDIPIHLDLLLKSISISTSRGFLFSRLMGTYLHHVILPIISIPFGDDVNKLALKRIKNIEFSYSEGVSKSEEAENSMINSINMWLSPFIKDFNDQNGIVKVRFKDGINNTISYEGISDDLKKKAKDYFDGFRVK